VRRALVTLGVAVTLLAAADRWLAARAAPGGAAGGRVGALFTPEEAARLRKQPALRVELPGESHAYGRIEGVWRCLSAHGAPADGAAIQALIDGIAGAEGIVHARGTEEAPAFGINTPRTLRVSLQGPRALQDPGGDVLATLEIGLAQEGGRGCFVRRKGTAEIWSIAGDLRAPLEARLAPGLPPLLAAGVLPEEWLAQSELLRLELRRGTTTVLERRERTLDPATMKPGDLPWRWVLAGEGEEREVPEAYVRFVLGLSYRAVRDPAERATLVPDPPAARLVLEPRAGASQRLDFGPPLADGGVPLWVEARGVLYVIDPRVAALALPDEDTLVSGEDSWSSGGAAGGAATTVPEVPR